MICVLSAVCEGGLVLNAFCSAGFALIMDSIAEGAIRRLACDHACSLNYDFPMQDVHAPHTPQHASSGCCLSTVQRLLICNATDRQSIAFADSRLPKAYPTQVHGPARRAHMHKSVFHQRVLGRQFGCRQGCSMASTILPPRPRHQPPLTQGPKPSRRKARATAMCEPRCPTEGTQARLRAAV